MRGGPKLGSSRRNLPKVMIRERGAPTARERVGKQKERLRREDRNEAGAENVGPPRVLWHQQGALVCCALHFESVDGWMDACMLMKPLNRAETCTTYPVFFGNDS